MLTALEHNYDLALARVASSRRAHWSGSQRRQFYPQIGYQAFAGREKTFVPLEKAGGNLTFNAFGALLNLDWELDVWGRIRRSTEAARANLFAQEDVRRGVMLTSGERRSGRLFPSAGTRSRTGDRAG